MQIYFPKMYRKLLLFFLLSFTLIVFLWWSNIIAMLISYFYIYNDGNKISVNINKISHYGAIIDAGSSGSRLFLYTWPTHSGNGEELLDIRPLLDSRGHPVSKKVTPGLSSYAERPGDVDSYMKELLDVAAANIPLSQHRETPLYVMATAGMRMINKEAQSKILDNIRQYVKKHYDFLFSDSHAKVITGREEGIYGWITTNYLLGRFNHNHSDGVPIIPIPYGDSPLRSQAVHHRKRTVGVIDMGGGSMQIAYELAAENAADISSTKVVNLGCKDTNIDHTYKLFVTTYLGFGANIARTRFERNLVHEFLSQNNDNITHSSFTNETSFPSKLYLEDPCLHPGLELTSAVRVVNDSQGGLNLSPKQIKKLPLLNTTFRGTGRYSECKTRLTVLLDNKPCPTNGGKSLKCSMAGRLHPAIDLINMQFYGFSEFWYSTNDVFELGGMYNYFKLHSQAVEHCKESWFSIILKQKRGIYRRADWPRLRYQCFKSAWITTVLHEGLGFPTTYNKFTSVMEVNGAEVQWSLGALLYQTRFFPLRVIEEKEREKRRELLLRRARPTGTHTYLLFVATVLVAAIVLWMHMRRRWSWLRANRRSFVRDGPAERFAGATVIDLESTCLSSAKGSGAAIRDFQNWM